MVKEQKKTKSVSNKAKQIKKETKETQGNIPEIENTLKYAIEGILDKKGVDVVYIDLKKINSSICDYFVICHGTSDTHVGAIAASVEEQVKKNMGVKPAIKEGFANSEWILLDYLDVVVHIFKEDVRNFYKLEDLWADAPLTRVE